MNRRVNVLLAKERPVIFPNKCVACGVAEPFKWVEVESKFSLAAVFLRNHVTHQVPFCRACERSLRNFQAMNAFAWLLATIMASSLSFAALDAAGLIFKGWAGFLVQTLTLSVAFAVVLKAISPWQQIFDLTPSLDSISPALVIDVEGRCVRFSFRNSRVAAEFRNLNELLSSDGDA